ncbi:MAG: hypothetical protein H0W58_01590 [Acidobacteria bacterium]|jgi:hypothetical protein|nr:hypothetical protein [Acidobacteriota bacterium]
MAENNEIEPQGNKSKTVNFNLNFRIPTRMPSVYAHHLFIQDSETEVLLSFFEVIPPIIMQDAGAMEERIKMLQEAGINAECVARITVSKHRFIEFAKAIETIKENLEAQVKEGVKSANNKKNNRKS